MRNSSTQAAKSLPCRDVYREQLAEEGMHAEVVKTFVDALVRITAPITPHWADHIFRNVLKAGDCVLTAGWPQLPAPDFSLRKAAEYVEKTVERVRAAVTKKEAPPKKKKGVDSRRTTCIHKMLHTRSERDWLVFLRVHALAGVLLAALSTTCHDLLSHVLVQ